MALEINNDIENIVHYTIPEDNSLNLDNLFGSAGMWKVRGLAEGATVPSGSKYGVVLNLPYNIKNKTDQDFDAQIFIPNGDDSTRPNSMFYRTAQHFAWNPWNEVCGIVERGSNANGNYIKYMDGTLICWHQITGNQFDCTGNIQGRFYFSGANNDNENSKQWYYPSSFTQTPTVFVNVGSKAYGMVSSNINKTSAIGYCVLPYPVDKITFVWNFLAIGRWK